MTSRPTWLVKPLSHAAFSWPSLLISLASRQVHLATLVHCQRQISGRANKEVWQCLIWPARNVSILVSHILVVNRQQYWVSSSWFSAVLLHFRNGLRTLLGNRNVWASAVAYSIPGGIVGAWSSVMTINFNNSLGIDDEECGRIGVISVAACCVIAFSAAYLTDKVKKHIKVTLLVLLLLTAGCFAWMGMLCLKFIPYSRWQLYVSTIGENITNVFNGNWNRYYCLVKNSVFVCHRHYANSNLTTSHWDWVLD